MMLLTVKKEVVLQTDIDGTVALVNSPLSKPHCYEANEDDRIHV